ncbi:MAG: GNAT family N-acetyltransferase, partial [Marmoricola sp.]
DDSDAPAGGPRRTRLRQQMKMLHSWEGEPGRYFLAHRDGVPVGFLVLHTSDYDNPDLVWIELAVHPEHRRQGIGSWLHQQAEALARDIGRPSVLLEGWDDEATRAFAAASGYPVVSVSVTRVQDLSAEPAQRARFVSLRAEAEQASAEYDLLRITGRSSQALLEQLVEVTAAINDAPSDDLDIEDEVFSAERVRAYEQAQLGSGFRFRRVVAVERSTGAIAGHTVVVVDAEQPAYGEQHDTVVVPAHRGHRLGLRLKSDMLCWLAEEEPQLRRLVTDNAESNDPMIAVNERLGYRVAGRRLALQRRL